MACIGEQFAACAPVPGWCSGLVFRSGVEVTIRCRRDERNPLPISGTPSEGHSKPVSNWTLAISRRHVCRSLRCLVGHCDNWPPACIGSSREGLQSIRSASSRMLTFPSFSAIYCFWNTSRPASTISSQYSRRLRSARVRFVSNAGKAEARHGHSMDGCARKRPAAGLQKRSSASNPHSPPETHPNPNHPNRFREIVLVVVKTTPYENLRDFYGTFSC